jgi:hypothetical protein
MSLVLVFARRHYFLCSKASFTQEFMLFSFSIVKACLYAFEQNTCSLSVSVSTITQG